MAYEELKKNNVSAKNQLGGRALISYIHPEGKGRRVLFVGNSITLHSPKADIGWNDNWGMAASAEEKDYVHLMANAIGGDAAFCVCQAADWERGYKNPHCLLPLAEARDFGADVVVLRLVENCIHRDIDLAVELPIFEKAYGELVEFLTPRAKTVVLTTGFWPHPLDAAIRACAEKKGLPLVELGDLGMKDEMKAVGLFWHSGVANHPGDLGMAEIARRILEKIPAEE